MIIQSLAKILISFFQEDFLVFIQISPQTFLISMYFQNFGKQHQKSLLLKFINKTICSIKHDFSDSVFLNLPKTVSKERK
jgi:hypothetical protein